MALTLFETEERNEDGKLYFSRKVQITFDKENSLLVFGCDVGQPVKSFYADSGIEYSMTINSEGVNKLLPLLKLEGSPAQNEILLAIQNRFKIINCYYKLKEFLEQNKIKCDCTIWR